MWDTIEEYESLFWEKFLNQIYGIQLERVTHIQNWSMYIRVLGYLRAKSRETEKHGHGYRLVRNQEPLLAKANSNLLD